MNVIVYCKERSGGVGVGEGTRFSHDFRDRRVCKPRREPVLSLGEALASKLIGVEGKKQTSAVTFPLLFMTSRLSQRGRGCLEEERRTCWQAEEVETSVPEQLTSVQFMIIHSVCAPLPRILLLGIIPQVNSHLWRMNFSALFTVAKD